MRIVKRGEIYYAELYGVGSVQTGSRPVLVYSNNENNRHSSTINVIPLTAELKSLCVHVLVEEYLECGLKEKSMLLPEQLTTIDKSQLKSKVGKLSTIYMKKIDKAIDIQFARNRNTNKELANE